MLPNEILVLIFKWSDLETLVRISHSSKFFDSIVISSPEIFHDLVLEGNLALLKLVLHKYLHMALFVKSITISPFAGKDVNSHSWKEFISKVLWWLKSSSLKMLIVKETQMTRGLKPKLTSLVNPKFFTSPNSIETLVLESEDRLSVFTKPIKALTSDSFPNMLNFKGTFHFDFRFKPNWKNLRSLCLNTECQYIDTFCSIIISLDHLISLSITNFIDPIRKNIDLFSDQFSKFQSLAYFTLDMVFDRNEEALEWQDLEKILIGCINLKSFRFFVDFNDYYPGERNPTVLVLKSVEHLKSLKIDTRDLFSLMIHGFQTRSLQYQLELHF